MPKLILTFAFLIPFSILSIQIGGGYVEISTLLAGVICTIVLANTLTDRLRLRLSEAWLLPFIGFVIFCFSWLLLSDYFPMALGKGLVQLMGICIMLCASLAVSRATQRFGIQFLYRPLLIALIVIASIGIWQCIDLNILRTGVLSDLSSLVGSSRIWRHPGALGGWYRINSLNAEPAHFTQYLAILGGIAMLRLGFGGREHRNALRSTLPRHVVTLFTISFLLALSIIGYAIIGLLIASIFLITHQIHLGRLFSRKVLIVGSILLLGGLGGIRALSSSSDAALLIKIQTIPTILTSQAGVESVATEAISSLALGANISVALANFSAHPLSGGGLGTHPLAYARKAPDWIQLHPTLIGLNSDDAASLLLRLLSETGLIGTGLYLSGFAFVVFRARQAILHCLTVLRERQEPIPQEVSLCVGFLASTITLFIVYLARMGLYYAPTLWLLLGISAAIPTLVHHPPLPPRPPMRQFNEDHCS